MDEVIEPKIQRRARIEIVVQILDYLKRAPSRKTQLSNECNLNYTIGVRYLEGLIKAGYIVEHSLAPRGGAFYTISEAGGQILIKLQESIELVEGVLEGE